MYFILYMVNFDSAVKEKKTETENEIENETGTENTIQTQLLSSSD